MTSKDKEEMIRVRDFMLKYPNLGIVACVYQALGIEDQKEEKDDWPDWAYETLKRAWGSKGIGTVNKIFLSIISARLKREPQVNETLGEVKTTARGFGVLEFKDLYGARCTIQESSLATQEAIWLGVHGVEPKVVVSEAHLVGVSTTETCGWVDYPIPSEVLLNSRMHLSKDQVKLLISHLQRWLDTGRV